MRVCATANDDHIMLAQVSQIKRKALIHDIERIADLSKCFTEQRYLLLAWDQEVPRGLCFFCHVPVILGRSNVRSVANLPVSLATLIVADDLGSGMKQTWLCLSLVFCVSFLMTPCFAWSDAVILVSKSAKLILNGPITRVRDKTIEIDTKYGVLPSTAIRLIVLVGPVPLIGRRILHLEPRNM